MNFIKNILYCFVYPRNKFTPYKNGRIYIFFGLYYNKINKSSGGNNGKYQQ